MMSTTFKDIYRGKRVLITGHTGFKGSWLSFWLARLGAEVIGYSNGVPTHPSHFVLLKLNIVTVTDDILNLATLTDTVKRYRPDVVFHMAAQPIVRKSYREPVTTFATNIMGTINLLESCRQSGNVKAIVNITSDKCYKNQDITRGYTEDDPMGGNDPYSASKGSAELVSHAYRHSFFNPADYKKKHSTLLANVRAGNVIGGGDWAEDRLIPDIMRAASQSQPAIIRNPNAIRPWQHVLEPLSGYLHVGWKLLTGQPEFADNWNFGPPNSSTMTVHQVIANTQPYWNQIRYEILENPTIPHEDKLLTLDSSKARQKLPWNSVWDGPTTFQKTVEWYKRYYQSGELLTTADLDQYTADAHAAGIEWANG